MKPENIAPNNQKISPLFRPRLSCKVSLYPEQIVFFQGDRSLAVTINDQSPTALQKLFLMMDGTKSLGELQQQFFPQDPDILSNIVQDLDEQGLIDDATPFSINSGINAILELEALTTKLLVKHAAQECFWQQIASADREIAIKVLSGLAIEYYHFCSQQFCFAASNFSFPSSHKIQQLINQYYWRKYGQDEILLEALNTINISQEDLTNSIPLPQTTALVHSLTFWANFEPIFFLTTLEAIATQTLESFTSCLQISEQLELKSAWLNPIKRLIDTKLKLEPENLTRLIFQEIPHLEQLTKERFKGQTHLFWEIYASFYQAIWDYYSSAQNLSCRSSEFGVRPSGSTVYSTGGTPLRVQHFLQKLLMGETPKTALLRFSQVGEPAQRKCFTAT